VFTEEQLLPLSGLQHLAFCERQWALIHLEQQWVENRLTAEGRILHEKADSGRHETRNNVRILRSLDVSSLRLGLSGRADVVELHPGGICIPVESKRGRPKLDRCDEVQICAIALCLEEMLSVQVELAYLFYGQTRHRTEVNIDAGLRQTTENLAAHMHRLYAAGLTPKPVPGPKCRSCSLFDVCEPYGLVKRQSAANYMQGVLRRALEQTVATIGDVGQPE
jgi:CRISPR-associated exonuclease Cas4